jgi:hypothetical protein
MPQISTAAPLGEWGFRKGRRIETEGNGVDKDIALPWKDLEQLIGEPEEIGAAQKISPEILYRVTVPVKEDIETPKILRVREIIQEAMDYLSNALNIDDEIERESLMNLFAEILFKLTEFLKINKNLKDAICLVQTAIDVQIKSVYERNKILALEKVLGLMKDNILMDVDILNECFDILESAGFDLNAPLAGVELAL